MFTSVVVDHMHLETTRGLANFSTLKTRIGKAVDVLFHVAPHVVLAPLGPALAHLSY